MFRFMRHSSRNNSRNIYYFRKGFTNNVRINKNAKRSRHNGSSQILKNSLLPQLGVLSLLGGIGGFSYAYHNNEEFRNTIHQYVSSDIEKQLNDLIGPESFKSLKNTVDYIQKFYDTYIGGSVIDNESTNSVASKQIKKEVTRPMNKTLQNDSPESAEKKLKNILIELNQKSTYVQTVFSDYESQLKIYSDKLKNTLDNMGKTNDMKQEERYWKDIQTTVYERNYAKARVEKEITELKNNLSKYESDMEIIKANSDINSNPHIAGLLTQMNAELNDSHNELNEKQKRLKEFEKSARFQDEYSKKVSSARQQIIRELEGLEYFSEKEVTGNDDLLILHAHKRLLQLVARIAEIEANFEPTIDNLVNQEMVKIEERVREEIQYDQQKIIDQHVSEELATKEAAQVAQVAKLLKIQRDEFDREQELKIRTALLREKDRLNIEIEQWNERVQGLEAAVEGRANQEKQIKEARELWVSGRILNNLLYRADDTQVTPPLDKYVVTLVEASCPGRSRQRVEELCKCIPKRARDEGVFTMKGLVERWDRVYEVGRKVSMVPETGTSIIGYFLSWARSKILMKPNHLIGIDSDISTTDATQFDPNLILESANKAMTCNNLGLTVRILTLLHGMPRVIADDWIKDTVEFLETSHIIEAVESYTASRTVGVAEEQQQYYFTMKNNEKSKPTCPPKNSYGKGVCTKIDNTNTEDNKCASGRCNAKPSSQ